MCGRFVLSISARKLMDYFGVSDSFGHNPWSARYNIAPSQPVLLIRPNSAGRHEAVHTSWGLLPSWAKDANGMRRPINARSETAAEKPTFRAAMKYRRCLIPANAFYEWQNTSAGKIPHAVQMADREPFAFAGLWEHWQSDDGSELETCTILTTQANAIMAKIHDRMPVMLATDNYDTWLNGELHEASALLRPYRDELMTTYPVTHYVNNTAHQGARCLTAVEDQEPTLF